MTDESVEVEATPDAESKNLGTQREARACGFLLLRRPIKAAIKAKPESGHLRLGLAFVERRGCTLTADQVDGLVSGDGAIGQAIAHMTEAYLTPAEDLLYDNH